MIRAAQMLRGERLVFCTIYQYIIIGKRYYAPPPRSAHADVRREMTLIYHRASPTLFSPPTFAQFFRFQCTGNSINVADAV